MEGEEFKELVEDIKEFGQIEPATIYQNKILDGRNRYNACKELNIELLTKEWNPSKITGRTPLQYVISENIMRRNLNQAQKAEIGMILYPEIAEKVIQEGYKEQKKTKEEYMSKTQIQQDELRKLKAKNYRSTAQIVAQKVKTSPSAIKNVKKISEIAKNSKMIADEWNKAKKGETTIDTVYYKSMVVDKTKDLTEIQQQRLLNK